jgi:hypothetical protein
MKVFFLKKIEKFRIYFFKKIKKLLKISTEFFDKNVKAKIVLK